MLENPTTSLVAIILLGISAQWLAWRVRIPSILLLLSAGFLAGAVTGVVRPDDLLGDLLSPLVSLAVAVILFEGALTLKLSELPEIGRAVYSLVTIGVLTTWVLGAVAARVILGMPWTVAFLVAAILSVSGPTVIGPLLQQVRPLGRVGAILKWESIIIDPVGVLLALLVYEVLFGEMTPWNPAVTVMDAVKTVLWGGGIGAAAGGAIMLLFGRYWVPDFLQSAVALAMVIVSFAVANEIQDESGLVVVTVMGVLLANQRFASMEHIVEFKENLRVLLISALFIVLAARLKFADLQQAGLASLVFAAALILAVRPIAVWLATLGSGLNIKEKLFLSWVAPRGIVAASISSVFALYLEDKDHEQARLLVPVTFAVIIATVATYGLSASFVARWLGLADADPQGVLILGADPFGRGVGKILQDQGIRVLMIDRNRDNIAAARLSGLPTLAGSVHHDYLLEDIDFAGIGRLLALTGNDAVNVLATRRFRSVFGRAEVYQLPPYSEPGQRLQGRHENRGRLLFSDSADHDALDELLEAGAVFKATTLTKEFTYQDYAVRFDRNALPLFVITQQGKLRVITADQTIAPQAGQTVISLVTEKPVATSSTEPEAVTA